MRINKNILLLITAIAAFLLLLLIFFMNQGERTAQPEIKTTGNESKAAKEETDENYTVLVPKDICEGCHMSGKSSVPQALTAIPHQNGGAYCLSCHVISHEKHPIDRNVTCEKCHGKTPGKPVYVNGNISCNNCHDYPDPLLPSKGNIITIHRSRGISCNSCHTDTCTKCHKEQGAGEKWIKRMDHFRLVAGKI